MELHFLAEVSGRHMRKMPAQRLEHPVAGVREHAVAASAGGGTERVSEKGLADADGPDDGDVGARPFGDVFTLPRPAAVLAAPDRSP